MPFLTESKSIFGLISLIKLLHYDLPRLKEFAVAGEVWQIFAPTLESGLIIDTPRYKLQSSNEIMRMVLNHENRTYLYLNSISVFRS